ncbi:EamA family transporter [Acinetobacter sp. ANC 4558]|uniref:DMT family transporter n=1 Tax=Acinetobacter sp. ANC 4558 TaxID=1977876 RepID=UPI000A32F9A1|nr:DMT family transporter [Acinetobacter sp. ANC 4558]OTG85875.1 EamA family transporter [Acinetobacter sp. ANC 4558]
MQLSDYIRLIVLAAIWGASFLFMRIAVPQFNAINTAFLRVFFGLIGLIGIFLILRMSFTFKGKLGSLLILGIINTGLPFLMYCFAANWLSVGYSSILNATTPLMGALIGFSFFNEKLSLRKCMGVFLGLVGIMIITTFGKIEESKYLIWGVISCLIATSCYGLSGFLTRKWISEEDDLDSTTIAFGSQIGAILFLIPFFIFSLTYDTKVNWLQADVWACVIAVGIICTALAYILYFQLITNIGPLRSLTVTFLIPPFAVMWGYFFLDEVISGEFIIGALIVCIAVWLIIKPNHHLLCKKKN